VASFLTSGTWVRTPRTSARHACTHTNRLTMPPRVNKRQQREQDELLALAAASNEVQSSSDPEEADIPVKSATGFSAVSHCTMQTFRKRLKISLLSSTYRRRRKVMDFRMKSHLSQPNRERYLILFVSRSDGLFLRLVEEKEKGSC
jgi:hypothetical protein